MRLATLLIVVAAGGWACSRTPAAGMSADFVLQNGRIITIDEAVPEAQGLASSGDKIVFVGSTADVMKYIGASTKVIDLNGQLAVPGFIEGHGHFIGIGESKLGLDLTASTSWNQIVQMIAEAVKTAGSGQFV
jgi:predicted amidohydrolase YtcJ